MWYKRYQYYSKEGICWSDWFPFSGKDREPWQVKGKLKNEYRYEETTD